MLRTLFLFLLVAATAARGQPDFSIEFKKLETELVKLQECLLGLDPQISSQQELRLVALEMNFQSISGKIEILEDSISGLKAQILIPEQIRNLEVQTSEELLIRRVSNFRSFVLAWYDLGEQLEAISATAESILIFPDSRSKSRVLINIGQYAGVGGGIAGAVMANKNPTQGVTTIGLSLSVTGMLGLLFKNKQPRVYIENVSRNIAFTDNIRAFERIASSFSQKAGALYHSVKDHWDEPNWRPGNKELKDFYALIILRKDLNVIVRHMKAKAEHLLSFPLTDEGRQHLNNLVFRYNKALQSWEISEIVYLNTYEFLAKSTQGSFWR